MQPFRPPPGRGVPPLNTTPAAYSIGVPVGAVAVNPAMMAMRGPPPRGPPPMFAPGREPPPMVAMGIPVGMVPRPMPAMVIPGSLGPRPVLPQPGMMMHRMAALPETGPLNVFVGKLPTDLNDSYVRNLLEKCGHVVSWKRTADPVTNKPKAFGYCTYSNALDVMRVLRLLNGFSMDSKQILVKVDTKTQAKLDEFAAAMTEPMKVAEQARDEELRRVLKSLEDERSGLKGGIQNHPESWGDLLGTQSGESVGADLVDIGGKDETETSDSAAQEAPVETKVQQKMILTEIEKFRLAQEQREREQEQKRRDALRERLRREEVDDKGTEEREPLVEKRSETPPADESMKAEDPVLPGPQEPISDGKQSSGDEEASNHRRPVDGTPDPKTTEKSRARDRERRRDRDQRDRSRDRDRDRSRDRERRKRARSKSRSRSRSHSRERSHRRRRRSSRTHSRSRSRSRSRDRNHDRKRDRDDRRRRRRHSSAADDELKGEERRSKRRRDSRGDDKDVDDVKEQKPVESARAPPVKVVMELKMPLTIAPKKEKPAPQPTALQFQLEEVAEEKPARELIRIDFDAEEKQETALAQERAAAAATKISSRTEDVKTLINRIPTDSAGLFAYPIDWAAVDEHGVVQAKMEPWVTKKVLEYVGEEDKIMIEFILSKLSVHAKPTVILDELQVILEDEAEVFVKLLWRKLAFEALRAGA